MVWCGQEMITILYFENVMYKKKVDLSGNKVLEVMTLCGMGPR